MKKATKFGEILEAADRLSLEEKGTIIDILTRRVNDERRKQIVQEVHEAQQEFKEGRCHPATSEEIVKAILS